MRAGLTALAPLFCVMAAALAVRAVEAAGARRSWAEALDVLTGPGRALVWTAAAATAGAALVGWASLAVLGLFGLGVAYVTVTWAALVAAGPDAMMLRARLRRCARGFAPSTAMEGDVVREQLTVRGARVPAGFRLLVRGGVARHPSTSYVLDTDISDGELSLEAELGPARRGEYEVPPAELWLQDLFGLVRSRVLRLGPGKLTVLPRPAAIDDPTAVAAARGDDAESVPAQKLPTEGCFRLRAVRAGRRRAPHPLGALADGPRADGAPARRAAAGAADGPPGARHAVGRRRGAAHAGDGAAVRRAGAGVAVGGAGAGGARRARDDGGARPTSRRACSSGR